MTEKFYNDMFGDSHQPTRRPWQHDNRTMWPSLSEQEAYWHKQREDQDGRMHRCPQCGCLFTGGEA